MRTAEISRNTRNNNVKQWKNHLKRKITVEKYANHGVNNKETAERMIKNKLQKQYNKISRNNELRTKKTTT
jgi:hypothetical protein